MREPDIRIEFDIEKNGQLTKIAEKGVKNTSFAMFGGGATHSRFVIVADYDAPHDRHAGCPDGCASKGKPNGTAVEETV